MLRKRVRGCGRGVCLAASALATIVLSGCAAINPYWKSPFLKRPDATSTEYAGGLAEAINYARGWQTQYYRNAGQDALVHNSAVLGIPLAGAALFQAATGHTNSHSAIGLGIGGATLYGIANSLSSPPRQRVYMAGTITLSCAIDAMSPYAMTSEEYGNFKTNLAQLQSDLKAVSDRMTETQRVVAAVKADTGKPPALDSINAAQEALKYASAAANRARAVLADGYLLGNRVSTSGLRLITSVDAIVARVGDQLAQTQVDLQSLASIVSNLGTTASTFRPTPPPVQAPPGGTKLQAKGNADIDDAVNALEGAVQDLETPIEVVGAYISASKAVSNGVANAGNPGACDLSPLDSGFHVDPDVDSITLAAGQSRKFTTSGGTGLPRGNVVGSTEATGAVLTPGQNDGSFTLSISATAKAGDVQVVFTDGTGRNRKVIAVTVTSGTPAPANGGGNVNPKQKNLPALTGVTPQQLSAIQAALNKAGIRNAAGALLKVDGKWGTDTSDALSAYQTRVHLTVTGTPTQETLNRLNPDFSAAANPPPPAAPGDAATGAAAAGDATGKAVVAPAGPASGAGGTAVTNSGGGAAASQPANGAGVRSLAIDPVHANAKNEFERTLAPEQIAKVRQAFGLPGAGGFDQALRAKIAAYHPATAVVDRPASQDELSAGLVQKILAAVLQK